MPSSRALTEYGDKDNSDLSERFKIGADDFPQYRLWTKGKDSTTEPVKFSADKKADEFMKFCILVHEHKSMLTARGCIYFQNI